MKRTVLLIDMQSFYCGVEKVRQSGLDDKPIVVAGDPERRSGVILAACPIAKTYGVETAEALWQAQAKCPDLVIIKPSMQLYIDISVQITRLLYDYSDRVEPFSVDEFFVELTGTPHQNDPEHAARMIQKHIYRNFGVYGRVGIGENKMLSKLACDNMAKKNQSGIFTLHRDRLEKDLWPLPIDKLFGVGKRMEKHFQQMGIRTIGQLAKFPLEELQYRWGINGEVLYQSAHGIDYAPVTPDTHQERKAIGHSMTLPRDYRSWEEIKVVVRELAEEVAFRVRQNHVIGETVHVGARYFDGEVSMGFSNQQKLEQSTNDGKVIFNAAVSLFQKHWQGYPLRSISVSLDKLHEDQYRQLNLFGETSDREELNKALDDMNKKYGKASVFYASSLTTAGQAKERAAKIGGHYK